MDVTGWETDSIGGSSLQADSANFARPFHGYNEQPASTSLSMKPQTSTTSKVTEEITVPRKTAEKKTDTIAMIHEVLRDSVYCYHGLEVKDKLQKLCARLEKFGPDTEYHTDFVVELLNRLDDESMDQVFESISKPGVVDGGVRTEKDKEAIKSVINSNKVNMAEKNKMKDLKPELQCKVCLDNPVAVAFVPCGHLVACVSCTSALFECPVCRAQIRGTIRAYL